MIEIYDIECFKNFFSYYGINTKNEKEVFFYFHENVNQIDDLKNHLTKLTGMIGFNNVNYDYPLLHYIMTKPNCNIDDIYKESQRIINAEFSRIQKPLIPQLDLYLINHYDNKARRTSLKWLEFTLRWNKLQDLPFKHYDIIEKKSIENIKKYNRNDVLATKFFLEKHCIDSINFRKITSEKLKTNVMNFSDVKIGTYLNQITYEKLSGKKYNNFKNDRTYRKIYYLDEIIDKNISFQTDYLKSFLNDLKSKSFKSEDDISINTYLKFANNTFKFAKGGLHTEDIPRIVSSDDEILMEKDVASFYPASIINSKLYPQHLGVEWYIGVKDNYEKRTFQIKPLMKSLDKNSKKYKELDTEQAAIKLSLNGGSFGMLGSEYSWQYDPLQKYKITINCELKLLMLIESFDLAKIKIISANTDGVVIKYPKTKQSIVDLIHKNWENKFNYILEDTHYNKIIFSSVNDYIAEIIDPESKKRIKIKYKGDYEIDKDPHKNNSQRIVPICLSEYFINNINPSNIINNLDYKFINSKGNEEKTTIYDYCIGKKKGKEQLYHYVEKNKTTTIDDKVIRYYIVDNYKFQNKIFKEYKNSKKCKNNNKSLEAINKGFNHMLFMDYVEKKEYHIDKNYYLQECMKIIKPIEINTKKLNFPKVKQLSFF